VQERTTSYDKKGMAAAACVGRTLSEREGAMDGALPADALEYGDWFYENTT
jgi:hypothetical protein